MPYVKNALSRYPLTLIRINYYMWPTPSAYNHDKTSFHVVTFLLFLYLTASLEDNKEH